jgi:ATP-binding cassette subfamily F protein 3
MIVWQRPNLLLLDEPTNHLDLATREALSVALNEFEGTVLLVSHDRALLRAVCDEFWLVAGGRVAPFDGDLDDYQRYLLDEAKRLREAARQESAAAAAPLSPPPAPAPAVSRPSKARAQQMKKALAQAEQHMARLQGDKEALEQRLAAGLPPAEIADTGRKLKALTEELETAEERWLALSSEIESFEA